MTSARLPHQSQLQGRGGHFLSLHELCHATFAPMATADREARRALQSETISSDMTDNPHDANRATVAEAVKIIRRANRAAIKAASRPFDEDLQAGEGGAPPWRDRRHACQYRALNRSPTRAEACARLNGALCVSGSLDRPGYRCEGTPQRPECRAAQYRLHPETGARVVLTIANMNHDVTDNGDENLRALCQLCHNSWDAPKRHLSAWFTHREIPADGDLFGLRRPRSSPVRKSRTRCRCRRKHPGHAIPGAAAAAAARWGTGRRCVRPDQTTCTRRRTGEAGHASRSRSVRGTSAAT